MECDLSKAKSSSRGTDPQQEETVSSDPEGDKSETTSTDASNTDVDNDNLPPNEGADLLKRSSSGGGDGTQTMPSVVMVSDSGSFSGPLLVKQGLVLIKKL